MRDSPFSPGTSPPDIPGRQASFTPAASLAGYRVLSLCHFLLIVPLRLVSPFVFNDRATLNSSGNPHRPIVVRTSCLAAAPNGISPSNIDFTDEDIDTLLFGQDVGDVDTPPTEKDPGDAEPPSNSSSEIKSEPTPDIPVSSSTAPAVAPKSSLNLNALKRNLIQRTIRENKADLLGMLSSPDPPNSAALSEKLDLLVSANPVTLTTDSNLLDGTWTEAWRGGMRRSRRPALLRPVRRRSVRLESIDGPEGPHVISISEYLWGILSTRKRIDIVGLTRRTLELDSGVRDKEVRVGRWRFGVGGSGEDTTAATMVCILYLDEDLCIEVEMVDGTDDTSPATEKRRTVYTKDESWSGASRAIPFSLKLSIQSRLQNLLRRRRQPLTEITADPRTDTITARALLIGEANSASDEEDQTFVWDAASDPWAHLVGDERLKALSKMSLNEIQEAVDEHIKRGEERRRRPGRFKGRPPTS
mmetsp:Transcript_15854/g.35691  ORF Transcript_15854/g.35691 Transcript_15854/m.35691 type:complete len:473 (-) Transcript_15854:74-1492(-)